MKKKVIIKATLGLSLILTGILTSRVMFASAENDFSGGGSGTEKDPYIIKTKEDLQKLGKYCGKDYDSTYFKIDETVKTLDMESKNFTSICSLVDKKEVEERYDNAFYGNFDGSNTEIINLKIETDGFFGGLFGAAKDAIIKNVKIGKNSSVMVNDTAIEIGRRSLAGGIVGSAYNTAIENVSNAASITGDGARAGGIVGNLQENSTLRNALNTGNVKAGKDNNGNSLAGGIVGFASDNVAIEDVSNTASITGDGARIGGIVGALQGYASNSAIQEGESTLKKASNTGNVKAGKDNNGNSYAGGIVGFADNSTIEDVSNTASVSGDGDRIGGIVCNLQENSTLRNALNYNENIIGKNHLGLLVGIMPSDSTSSVYNSYALKFNSMIKPIGFYDDDIVENVKGYIPNEFKDKSNFEGFDFDNTWTMGSDYPVLRDLSDVTSSNTTSSKVTVKYGNRVIDTSSYIHNNRTYVDLYDFCKSSGICDVEKSDNKLKKISRSQSLSNVSGGKYTYFVEHTQGTDTFRPAVLIGGRDIVDDSNKHESDVKSCPEDIKDENLQCGSENLFVPVRFLTQALGLRVLWDGKSRTVTIEDTLKETFNTKYETVITEGDCNKENISSCKVINKNGNGVYELSKNKTYYFELKEKETGKIKKEIKYFSFYNEVSDEYKKEVDKGVFSYRNGPFKIYKNQIEVVDTSTSKRDIAQVVIHEIEDDENITGAIPMVINASFIVK